MHRIFQVLAILVLATALPAKADLSNREEAKSSVEIVRYAYNQHSLEVARSAWPGADVALFNDPYTGLKSLLKITHSQGKTFIEVGFRGIWDSTSFMSAAAMGYSQSISPSYRDLLRAVQAAVVEAGEQNVVMKVNGHSLGGGLAQLFSYQMAKLHPEMASVRTITWNGVGGMDLIENNEGFDPKVAERIRTTHARLGEDIVASIGRHLPGDYVSFDTKGHSLSGFYPYVYGNKTVATTSSEPKRRFLVKFSQQRHVRLVLKAATQGHASTLLQLDRGILFGCEIYGRIQSLFGFPPH